MTIYGIQLLALMKCAANLLLKPQTRLQANATDLYKNWFMQNLATMFKMHITQNANTRFT
jgi:hypothetical protein